MNALLHHALVDLGILVSVCAGLTLAPSPLVNPPQVPFGVRVPPHRADAPEVTAQRKHYRVRLLSVGVATAAPVLLASAALDRPGVCGLGGALLITVAAIVLWSRAHRALVDAKEHGGWYRQTRQGAVADTSLRTDPVRFPWPWALPAVVTVVVSVLAGVAVYPDLPAELTLPYLSADGTVHPRYTTTPWTAFAFVIAQVLLTAAVAGTVAAVLRARADLDVSHPQTGAALYRRYLTSLCRSLLATAALMDMMLLGLSAMAWSEIRSQPLTALVIGLPCLATLAIAAHLLLRVGPGGRRLPAAVIDPAEADTGLVPRDDDRFWYGAGALYVNADDPAVLVTPRIGIGWTVNLGNPRFLALTSVLVALAVATLTVTAITG
ncbi:DUF1648 domain-containing protein [Streptomyces sp. NPDC004290]